MGLAGCIGGGSDGGSNTNDGGGGGGGGDTSAYPDLPTQEEGIEQWGQRLNEHAREAGIDWQQFEGEDITLRFGMGLHPYSTTTEKVIPYFEDLTGIQVEYEKFAEDQFWLEAERFVSDRSGRFDGIMVGLWPAGGYHWGDDGETWVRDLNQFIEDPSLTDKDWLAMDDFLDQTIELMTFPNGDGSSSFIGFPNGIEAYGCLAYDVPTFEELGLDEPTNFEELEDRARRISESDLQMDGIVSRTSSTVLSAANWGTMFKTHGADWIDREAVLNGETEGLAALNSEEGVASLERFGGMLNQYGPQPQPHTYDWYKNNTAFSDGQVGMMYSTPQTSGIVSPEQMADTKWLPPLEGPGGRDPVVDTWVWSTGISAFSENPEAAWLFIQWANSREANIMLSTKQWQGDQPRAGHARFEYVAEQRNQRDDIPAVPGDGYMEAFRKGMENVPGGRPGEPDVYPPVPVDTPFNMEIMGEAAQAMSRVIGAGTGNNLAQRALDSVAPRINDYASQIPERYIDEDRFA